ncbi:MAG TPA: prepilin-type N-terminal cleavage/methylation domain-containing protein, partial [Dermatophilaceae bacterium]
MTNFRRDLREDEGGFTLIELLVVIIIIGILAA